MPTREKVSTIELKLYYIINGNELCSLAQEIQRSLVRRARIRKAYFRMLEKEENQQGEDVTDERIVSENQKEDKDDRREPFVHPDRRKKTKPSRQQILEEKQKQREERLESKKQKEELRSKHKTQMTKYTKKGQPLMSSRVSRLLDKIQEQ